jgi:hypothetical protein
MSDFGSEDVESSITVIVSVSFDVELRLSPCWIGGNIGSTDATKTCHNLNAHIFVTNNSKE